MTKPKFKVGDIVIHTEISDLEWLPKDHPRKSVNLCIITDVYEMRNDARQLYGVHYFKLMRNESYVKESELEPLSAKYGLTIEEVKDV